MKRTIVEAIKEIMLAKGKPLTVSDVYNEIVNANLYAFKADEPLGVVRNQLRRHTEGLDFPSASSRKHFRLDQNGKYFLLPRPTKQHIGVGSTSTSPTTRSMLEALELLHKQYLAEFRKRVIDGIKNLGPTSFEQFCKNLLTAYGFHDMVITRASKDGGIDGHGRLKVGFADFNVAFQCKRWTRKTIGRPEIDQFRGAIQGQYEQGVFFTTANFSPDAKSSSFKAGAVTIIMIDGPTIVDIMQEKQFGIETKNLPVYDLALDLALVNEA